MSINDILGPLSVQSAGVLVAFGGSITAIAIALIVRTPRAQREADNALAVKRLDNENARFTQKQDIEREIALGKIASSKEIEIAKIDKHLIDLKPNKRTRNTDIGDTE